MDYTVTSQKKLEKKRIEEKRLEKNKRVKRLI